MFRKEWQGDNGECGNEKLTAIYCSKQMRDGLISFITGKGRREDWVHFERKTELNPAIAHPLLRQTDFVFWCIHSSLLAIRKPAYICPVPSNTGAGFYCKSICSYERWHNGVAGFLWVVKRWIFVSLISTDLCDRGWGRKKQGRIPGIRCAKYAIYRIFSKC